MVKPRNWMVVTAVLLTIPAYVQSLRVADYADPSPRVILAVVVLVAVVSLAWSLRDHE
ncbi:MAG: hypothetical protein ACRDMK_05840 [Gaiellaceae bacterium]